MYCMICVPVNILGCEEALASNPRRAYTYLNLHKVTDSLQTQLAIIGSHQSTSCPPVPSQRMCLASPRWSTTSIWMGAKRLTLDMRRLKMKSRPVASRSSYRPQIMDPLRPIQVTKRGRTNPSCSRHG